MTFKHGKFSDSPTLRSLERLAIEKKFFKDEPVIKTASTKLDLSVTPHFTSNLIKLCEGLRIKGLDTYADEIEANYIAFKTASSEIDEDIINQAHPKDAKVNDAIFHNVINTHLEMMNVVNKKTTGKLTTANEILKSVKKALGQEESPSTDRAALAAELRVLCEAAYTFAQLGIQLADSITSTGFGFTATNVLNLRKLKKVITIPNHETFVAAKAAITSIQSDINGDKDVDKESPKYLNIISQFNRATQKLDQAINKFKEYSRVISVHEQETGLISETFSNLNLLKGRIRAWLGREMPAIASAWVIKEMAVLDKIGENLKQIAKEQNYSAIPQIQAAIDAERGSINQFYASWKKWLG